MTFGFGRDTDEVNGFASSVPTSDADTYCDSLASDGDMLLPPLFGANAGTQRVLPPRPKKTGAEHPIFRPERIWCDYCKSNGHSLDFCAKRLEMNQKVANTWCTKGWHSPKLHDDRRVWRCKFCAMHLHEEYVWEVYPNECMAEEEKFFKHRLQVEKYMA